MEKDRLISFEERCTQEEPPLCRAACPIHVDAREFCRAWREKGASAARRVLDKTMPLTGLVAHMCETPCQDACLRREHGGAIAISRLEKAAVSQAERAGKFLRVPPKDKKAALLGGGISALCAAVDLLKKGWRVELFFAGEEPGASLEKYANPVPAAVLGAELEYLRSLGPGLHSGADLNRAALDEAMAGYDAVLLAAEEANPAELGLNIAGLDRATLQLNDKLFVAGLSGLEGEPSFIGDLCQGRMAATSIDRLLRGASLTASRSGEGPQPSRLQTDTSRVSPLPPVQPAGEGFSAAEAAAEAERCLNCQCMQCLNACEYLRHFKAYPKSYARQVYNNEAIVKGQRDANILINSCSLCGQCAEICPDDFSMADLCLQARRHMVDTGHMPPSAHYFALKEMESARDGSARLARHQAGHETSAWLFFPGCQLAGMRPEQVEAAYAHLCSSLAGGVGLALACCGAPAHWSGREALFARVLEDIRGMWRELDCPRVITACSSCLKLFKEHLPEMASVSLWELWRKNGPPEAPDGRAEPLAVSDPCSARHEAGVQQAVRALAGTAGYALRELDYAGKLTECCGFGGLMTEANPGLAARVNQRRAGQSEAAYLSYCAMCRDQLRRAGKRVLHLLDLYFPPEAADPALLPPCGLSVRWENRRLLKRRLLEEFWREQATRGQDWERLALRLEPELEALLEQRRILHDDIRQVLQQSLENGSCFRDGATGRSLATGKLGPVTYWLEYEAVGPEYRIHRAWSHRMVVERAEA